jgi:hypothetical protein
MKKKNEMQKIETDLKFFQYEFKVLPFEEKAKIFLDVLALRKKLNEEVSEIDAHMRTQFKERQVADKPARFQGVEYELYQGSGFEEKYLSKAEVDKFCEELHGLDPKAYAEIVEMVPSIKKKELNKYRTVLGSVADLINRYYATLNPKKIELRAVKK